MKSSIIYVVVWTLVSTPPWVKLLVAVALLWVLVYTLTPGPAPGYGAEP